jgi:hypothetical protein
MRSLWDAEPTMLLAVVQAGLALGMGFGLHISAQQMALILTFTGTVLALVNRSQVTSPASLQTMTPATLATAQDAAQPVRETIKKLPVVLLAVALGLGSSACSPKQYHHTVVANTTLAQAIFALQDEEMVAHDAKLISDAKHATYKAQILALLVAGDDLTLALRAWDPAQPMPANISAAITSVQTLLADLRVDSPTVTKVIFAAQTVLSVLRGSGVLPSAALAFLLEVA